MNTDKFNGQNSPTFTVENNILKGQKCARNTDYVNIGEMLLNTFESDPEFVGQYDVISGKKDTFASMRERSVKCALWLKKEGVKAGDVIAVCTNNHLDSFVPCVAALYIGAIFNPWNCEMNTQTARHFLKVSGPKVIFASENAIRVATEAAAIEQYDPKFVVFGEYPGVVSLSTILEEQNAAEVEKFRCTKLEDPHQAATILFSSGTTGLPKGVVLSHYALLYHVDVDAGINLDNQVTWLFISTSMGNRLLKSGYLPKYDLSSLNTVVIGGAVLKRESHEQLQAAIPHALVLQGYGMTEVGGLGTIQMPHHKPGSCGTVSRNVEIKVIEPKTGKALGPNQHGELCVKSLTMTTGYYNNPQATKDTIDEEGWIHTGDIGYYDEDGEFYILERIKELIKYRGYHVSPAEIEGLLQTHPSVKEVAVIGVPHPTDDEHPVAFVVKVPGAKVTEQELLDLVADNLMDHSKLRAGVKFINSFPYTATGKISRKELRSLAKSLAVH